MKRLLILRHAEAAPALDGDDFNRRLTARGQTDARAVGMAARGLAVPMVAIVSPAHRAAETFAVTAEAAGWRAAATFDPRLYEATTTDVRAILSAIDADAILVVGHNPTLAELATGSIAGGDAATITRMRRQFPPPCLAVIAFDVDGWDEIGSNGQLEHFLTPDMLS